MGVARTVGRADKPFGADVGPLFTELLLSIDGFVGPYPLEDAIED